MLLRTNLNMLKRVVPRLETRTANREPHKNSSGHSEMGKPKRPNSTARRTPHAAARSRQPRQHVLTHPGQGRKHWSSRRSRVRRSVSCQSPCPYAMRAVPVRWDGGVERRCELRTGDDPPTRIQILRFSGECELDYSHCYYSCTAVQVFSCSYTHDADRDLRQSPRPL